MDMEYVDQALMVLRMETPKAPQQVTSSEPEELDLIADLMSTLQLTWEQNDLRNSEDEYLLDKFRAQLVQNPYYFVNWFGDGQNDVRLLDEDQLGEFCHRLFHKTKRPRTKREIIEAVASSRDLVESEFSDRKTIVSFFIEAYVTCVLQRDGFEYDDPERNILEKFDEDGGFTPNKPSSPQIRSTRVAKWKWSRLAARANNGGLKFAEKLALQGWAIQPQYMPAVTYLNKWGRLHIALLKGRVPNCDPSEYNGEEDFNALPGESKGLILAAKSFYLAALRTALEGAKAESVQAMREAVSHDPQCFEWHYRLGMWLHCDRRSAYHTGCRSEASRPSDEEMQIRWETYEVCRYAKWDEETGENTMLRNMALACVMETLAEMARYNFQMRIAAPFELGDFSFTNIDEVVRFIKSNVPRLQNENYKPAFDELVRVGEMFASTLPKPYRNDAAALWFFEKALLMQPLNSKINHKMGLLFLASNKFPDVTKAINLLETAYLIEKHNIGAFVDMIKAMLSSPAHYKCQIKKYCESVLRTGALKLKNQELIWFLLGCLNFCIGKMDQAVDCWIKSEMLHFDGPSLFQTMSGWRWRYKWNSNILQPQDIKEQLESYAEDPNCRLPYFQRQTLDRVINNVDFQDFAASDSPSDDFTDSRNMRQRRRNSSSANAPQYPQENSNGRTTEWRRGTRVIYRGSSNNVNSRGVWGRRGHNQNNWNNTYEHRSASNYHNPSAAGVSGNRRPGSNNE